MPGESIDITFRNKKGEFAMNRSEYQVKEDAPASRIFVCSKLHRAVVALALLALVPATAIAQYPGGGAAPKYGSKGAVVGGVAAGAAAGAGLLYWKLHNRAKLQGCVAGSGDKLVNEKDNQTYNLTNKQNESLKPGERVELLGKKIKDASGDPTFEVHKMGKDLGQCTVTTAEQRQ
jgi:hypothetical protein